MATATVGHPDLPSFRVVQPDKRLNAEEILSKSRLQDGTPMVGPDGLLVPSGRSFSAIVNSATKVFSYRFDEAMRDNFINARAMRRDAFLRGLFEERILPTINREWILEVDDDKNAEQVFVRDGLTQIIKQIKDFDAFKRAQLDAVWFGRSGCQWAYQRIRRAANQWGIGKWDPLHGDSVQMTFDGTPAILLDAMTTGWYAQHGATMGPNGDLRPTDRGGMALVLQRPYWRDRFAIHVHMREKADYFEGELAGSVQGLGLRGLVYWQYVVRTDALTWMLAYMQAVGQMDLLVFNYPASDAAAKTQQEANARKVIGKAAIACPRNPTGNWPAIEQIQMNSAGLKALHDLVADYFDRHIERLFVGQSMSSGADKGDGLGGTGRSEFAKATKDEILVYDTGRLDCTLTSDLIAPLVRFNYPWANFPVRFKSVIPDLEAEKKVESGLKIASAGVEIRKDELREAAGYSRPEEGDETVGGMQPGMEGGPPGAGGAPGAAPPGMGGPMSAPPPGGGGAPPMQWQPGEAAAMSAAMMGPPGMGPGPAGPPAGGAPVPFQMPTRQGELVRLADAPPMSGPPMGYPGGGNTYIPRFGRPVGRFHEGKPLQPLIGFTRYDRKQVANYLRRGAHFYSDADAGRKLTTDEKQRARRVDLLVLPIGTIGTNCGNCKYVEQTSNSSLYCKNQQVRLPVNDRECCALWDHAGATRVADNSNVVFQTYSRPTSYADMESGSGNGRIRDKLGNEYDVYHEMLTNPEGQRKHKYTVGHVGGRPGINSIGGAETGWNKNRIMSVMVHPEHQRKGIASGLYDHIEKHLGTPLEENWATTPEGAAFWKARKAGPTQSSRYGRPAEYVTDAHGLEHKDAGPGGGQFTSKGGGGNSTQAPTPTPETPRPAIKRADSIDYQSREGFQRSILQAFDDPHVAQDISSMLQRVPDRVVQRLGESGGMRTVTYYQDVRDVTNTYNYLEERDGGRRSREPVGGFYDHETGDVHSDGGDPAGTLAHEMGHAIDFDAQHGAHFHSSSDEWRYIWSTELKSGRLTSYAATHPAEGFAEFCRWMFTNYSDSNPHWPAEVFPKSYDFFRRRGLI